MKSNRTDLVWHLCFDVMSVMNDYRESVQFGQMRYLYPYTSLFRAMGNRMGRWVLRYRVVLGAYPEGSHASIMGTISGSMDSTGELVYRCGEHAPRMEMRQAIASPRSCATLLTRSASCTQTTTYDVVAPVHTKETYTYKSSSISPWFRHLILSQFNTLTHTVSPLPLFESICVEVYLNRFFFASRPTHFTYNQTCPELVVKISLTRLVLLSR